MSIGALDALSMVAFHACYTGPVAMSIVASCQDGQEDEAGPIDATMDGQEDEAGASKQSENKSPPSKKADHSMKSQP